MNGKHLWGAVLGVATVACAVQAVLFGLGTVATSVADGATTGTHSRDASSSRVSASPSSGCGAASTVQPGESTTNFQAAGESGFYQFSVPSSYSSANPMPLVFDLHGYSDPAGVEAKITGLESFGDAHGFIVATPQVDHAVPMWNTGVHSQDVQWIADLLTHLEQQACIDQRRIYVTGYSDGAFMTSTVACALSSKVAAVSPIAGISDQPGCHPQRPVPVVAFHGTDDPFVPYNGGIGRAALNLPAPDGSGKTIGEELHGRKVRNAGSRSIPLATAGWARRNGCQPGAHSHRVTRDVTLITFRCPRDASVELYRVTGGGHSWPGSPVSATLAPVIGRTTFSIVANEIMWTFFRTHPLPR